MFKHNLKIFRTSIRRGGKPKINNQRRLSKRKHNSNNSKVPGKKNHLWRNRERREISNFLRSKLQSVSIVVLAVILTTTKVNRSITVFGALKQDTLLTSTTLQLW